MAKPVGVEALTRLLGSDWRGRRGPAYLALANRLRVLVEQGQLPSGTRLPSERRLAEVLGVGRTTVTAAYEELRRLGLAAARRGSGTVTSPLAGRRGLEGADTGHVSIDLTVAAPDLPLRAVLTAYDQAGQDLQDLGRTSGYDPFGLPALRRAIAARFSARGVPTTSDEILVTGGALHGLSLALGEFVRPGDRVVVESPGYPPAIAAAQRIGARLVTLSLGAHGWDQPAVAAAFAGAKLAHIVADYQSPTAAVMPAEQRRDLVAASTASRALVVVDETLADLRLDGPPLPPPVAAFDQDGHVITVGSLSKSVWGGLRVGWLRATPELVSRLVTARAGTDLAGPMLEQLAAVHLIDGLDVLLSLRQRLLRARRDALLAALADQLPEWECRVPHGGLSLWVHLGGPKSSALVRAAERRGVRLAAGARFGADPTLDNFLRLPFSAPQATLAEAVDRLAEVWRELPAGDKRGQQVDYVA